MTPTPEQFRAAGMTADAVNYPKPPAALIALKRFNGLRDDAPVPAAWHYFPNAWMCDNWRTLYGHLVMDLKENDDG
jgi:hypothetical protein